MAAGKGGAHLRGSRRMYQVSFQPVSSLRWVRATVSLVIATATYGLAKSGHIVNEAVQEGEVSVVVDTTVPCEQERPHTA